ncbi:hypothetical protein DB347_05010 [Opitutaceae bacterium EW11]|nr:hypothetical protein DB347_05010 [Opitutaceae bacterium EW11]
MKTSSALSLDRSVTCACDRALHVPVALEPTMSRGVHACLSCGTVTASEMLTRHVHHNTFEPYDRREIPLDERARQWLSAWPRLIEVDRGGPFFVPASTRIAKSRDLFDLAQGLRAAQQTLPRGRRLREAGLPAEPPPPLPEALEDFALTWSYAGLQPSDDPQRLLARADPRRWLSSPLAIDTLLQRTDVAQLVVEAIRNGDHYRRMTACATATESPALREIALPALLAWLEGVCLSHDPADPERLDEPWHIAAALDQIRRWKPPAAAAEAALEKAKQRIGRRDFELVRQISEILRHLRGEPPLPVSSTPWFFRS